MVVSLASRRYKSRLRLTTTANRGARIKLSEAVVITCAVSNESNTTRELGSIAAFTIAEISQNKRLS